MPRKYLKKQGVPPRSTWTEDALSEAVKRYRAGEIGLREAERIYRIPNRTLTRRMASGNLKKGSLGPQGVLNQENEKRLVTHIQCLGKAGFAPDRQSVRRLAYEFVVKLGIKHGYMNRAHYMERCAMTAAGRRRDKKSLKGKIRCDASLPRAVASIPHPKGEMANHKALVFHY